MKQIDDTHNEQRGASPASLALLDYEVNFVNSRGELSPQTDQHDAMFINSMALLRTTKPRRCRNCYGRGKTLASIIIPPFPKSVIEKMKITQSKNEMSFNIDRRGIGRGSIIHLPRRPISSNSTSQSDSPQHDAKRSVRKTEDDFMSKSACEPALTTVDNDASPVYQPSHHQPISDDLIQQLLAGNIASDVDEEESGEMVECHFMDAPNKSPETVSMAVTEEWTIRGQHKIEVGAFPSTYDVAELRNILEGLGGVKEMEERTTTSGHKLVRATLKSRNCVEFAVSILDRSTTLNKGSDVPVYCKEV